MVNIQLKRLWQIIVKCLMYIIYWPAPVQVAFSTLSDTYGLICAYMNHLTLAQRLQFVSS